MKQVEHSVNAFAPAKGRVVKLPAVPKSGFFANQVLKIFNGATYGRLTLRLPNDQVLLYQGKHDGPHGMIHFKTWKSILRYVLGGELSFAEGYMAGDIDVPSLISLFRWYLANEEGLQKYKKGSRFSFFMNRFYHRFFNDNSKSGSKKNISYHYDLGNAFYQEWLDPSMTYSSADFSNTDDLEDAQKEKYKGMAERANIKSGHNVLEIGCGWGGFAEYILSQEKVDYKGITISQEQLDYAKNRLKDRFGKTECVHFQDYRDTQGTYDSIVSVEMFEAVGENHWETYFQTIKNHLKDTGRASIQTITIEDDRFWDYRQGVDFIQKYIFPGGMLPSPEIFEKYANNAGLKVVDCYAFGKSYAETLRRWKNSFKTAWPKLEKMGFDQRFYRMWLYYLEYCEMGFEAGTIDVYQFSLAHKES